MSRWLAPLAGVVGLLTLVVGIAWAEFDVTSMAGLDLVGFGVLALLLAAAVAGAHEGAALLARRRRAVAGHPRRR
ncbi:hypothetical protein GCU56_04300 [Geodermatophilus sabuli]|uniref:Uncharacterized protein n=1 Tax=Geodermatophilus sabuli TaxID=1564158 RepID=A0A7K3VYA4_9ACTN|nr:hypothetical protein [Geodermatophilus sabuli]NEK57093.1 hypothetical protein [Geodermatophilus sabuli]